MVDDLGCGGKYKIAFKSGGEPVRLPFPDKS